MKPHPANDMRKVVPMDALLQWALTVFESQFIPFQTWDNIESGALPMITTSLSIASCSAFSAAHCFHLLLSQMGMYLYPDSSLI